MKIRLLLPALIAVLLMCQGAFAQSVSSVTDPYEKDVLKLLQTTSSREALSVVINVMLDQQKQAYPQVPGEVWEKVGKEMTGSGIDDLYLALMPVYKKHFTHEEVKELLRFFESPIGKKYLTETPVIMQESGELGEQWGRKIAVKVLQQLKDEGYGN